jgi:hypothetical protein
MMEVRRSTPYRVATQRRSTFAGSSSWKRVKMLFIILERLERMVV